MIENGRRTNKILKEKKYWSFFLMTFWIKLEWASIDLDCPQAKESRKTLESLDRHYKHTLIIRVCSPQVHSLDVVFNEVCISGPKGPQGKFTLGPYGLSQSLWLKVILPCLHSRLAVTLDNLWSCSQHDHW